MTAYAPLPQDDPRMIAWNAYKQTDEFRNTAHWAQFGEHTDGSLWAAFEQGYLAATKAAVFTLPDEIVDRLLAVGRVVWGTSHSQTDEKHVEDLRDTLRLTREHHNTEAENTAIHYLYLEDTSVVLANTGNSPNSPQHARILAGAWNQLVDMAARERQL